MTAAPLRSSRRVIEFGCTRSSRTSYRLCRRAGLHFSSANISSRTLTILVDAWMSMPDYRDRYGPQTLITLWLSDVSSTIVTRYSSPPGETRKTMWP